MKSYFASWTMRLVGVTAMLLLISTVTRAQDAVYLDHVDGLAYDGAIIAGQPITLYFAYRAETAAVLGATTGQIISSPDGATWSVPTVEPSVSYLSDFWDGGVFYLPLGSDGISPDTVGFGGMSLFKPGMPVGYDSLIYQVSFELGADQAGKTICVDSSWFPPGGLWLWSTRQGNVYPTWDGPHCFDVVPCCWDQSGDPNLDGTLNIADLDVIIDYLFRGGSLVCEGQANVDGESASGAVTVSDLSYFVAYLFQGGPPPMACQ